MIFLPKAALLLGLAGWLGVALFNNVVAFRNGRAALGGLMSMALFDQEPAIRTPLTARRVTSQSWHGAVYSLVLVVEAVVVLLLVVAGAVQLTGAANATSVANIAVASFIALAALMIVGGAWFAYYIRQETAQLAHLVMLGIGAAGAVLVNLPAM